MKLLLTGFLQVYFVVVNTYFISNDYYIGVLICSFVISFIWSLNVKKIAFGTLRDRFVYSTGASLGGLLGYFSSKLIVLL